jgi:hypothetical protein
MLSKKKSNLSNIRLILNFHERIWIFDSLVLNLRKKNSDYSLSGWFRLSIGMNILFLHESYSFFVSVSPIRESRGKAWFETSHE